MREVTIGVLALAMALAAPAATRADDTAAKLVGAAQPTAGPARVFGAHANGCIQGAEALPLDGPGWRGLRPQRNRLWGHPRLVATVKQVAAAMRRDFGRVVLVADLGQPRGGPVSGHASHQAGLDADIRFVLLPDAPLDPAQRDQREVSMLTEDKSEIDRAKWGPAQVAMLRAAASLPDTDRIFVHPLIKKELCRSVTGDRAWLRLIVPWYGHDGHMHVRIKCPADSPGCASAPPVPAGDGCGAALDWWFGDGPHRPRPPIGRRPALPAACATIAVR
jgi:penicillin-insensitive murein endopeptidase